MEIGARPRIDVVHGPTEHMRSERRRGCPLGVVLNTRRSSGSHSRSVCGSLGRGRRCRRSGQQSVAPICHRADISRGSRCRSPRTAACAWASRDCSSSSRSCGSGRRCRAPRAVRLGPPS
jgi:hypothetical protein